MPDYFTIGNEIFNWQFGEKWRERQSSNLGLLTQPTVRI